MSQPIPRSEYPRPQFVRPDWLCLNGPWEFQIDSERTLSPLAVTDGSLTQRITVPFCPESTLSGIGQTDFMPCVWYRRSVTVPKDWQGCRVLLHFEAVDDDATVWVNGVEVARHRGGSTPFTCDLGDHAQSGDTFTLVVRALDDHTQPKPQGKQCPQLENHGCLYTRTTGIWQTVWLEAVPMAARLEQPRITPDVTHHRFTIDQRVTGGLKGQQVRAVLQTGETHVAEATVTLGMDFTARLTLDIPEAHVRLWSPEDPHLYDLTLQLLDANGDVLDEATSYAGLRSIAIDGLRVLLNGKPVFQRLVLDQGYYPDGLLTAPSDDALRRDIELSIEAGFNGARLHQKVFEQRFLHHADRMGYLCWGEFGDWGPGRREDTAFAQPSRVTQWLEVLHRDYNHPCIVGWCPLNETNQRIGDTITHHDDLMHALVLATRAMDTTRPVLDTSGYSHRVPDSDIYDSHDYDQNPATFAARHEHTAAGRVHRNFNEKEHENIPYHGQPYFVSEFGGIWWNPDAKPGEASWGYGNRPTSVEEFYERFEGLCAALLSNPGMFGYCYTQLTDVFQEQNGIYHFDRRVKFDMQRIAAAQRQPAAIE